MTSIDIIKGYYSAYCAGVILHRLCSKNGILIRDQREYVQKTYDTLVSNIERFTAENGSCETIETILDKLGSLTHSFKNSAPQPTGQFQIKYIN